MSSQKHVDVLILGGGLAGLSTGYHLHRAKKNISFLIVEKESKLGGLAGSVKKDGFTFDYTGHLLHLHDPYGKKLILNLLKGNLDVHTRKSWIFSRGVFTHYPFQANTFGLPPSVVEECLKGFIQTAWPQQVCGDGGRKPPPSRGESFKTWSLRTFGPGISRRFLLPYNNKLWGMPLERMTTEWLGRFVPQPKIDEVLFGGLCEQKKVFGYNATFRYPKRGGAQALPDALARLTPNVVTEAMVTRVDLHDRVALIKGIGEVSFDRLVNTLPLKNFMGLLTPLPAKMRAVVEKLRHRTVYNLNIGIGRARISDKHWIYFPERKYNFYRAGFTHNFSPAMAPRGTSSMYIEIARPPGGYFDYAREENRVLRGLRSSGILKGSDKIVTKIWLPIKCGYVVYDKARTPSVNNIMHYLNKRGVQSIGRYGGWKYSFMEETIMDGKRCCERLLGRETAEKNPHYSKELVPLK